MTKVATKKDNLKKLRYKFYYDLDQLYHRFFDELAQADILEGDAAHLTQTLLNSRQDGLKHLLDEKEIEEYELNSEN